MMLQMQSLSTQASPWTSQAKCHNHSLGLGARLNAADVTAWSMEHNESEVQAHDWYLRTTCGDNAQAWPLPKI